MKVLKNRANPIFKYIKGDVLDIGCVGMGKNDTFNGEDFIHNKISELSSVTDLTGLDINKKGVDELKQKGFKMVCADAQEPYHIGNKFDTIISEENIEHTSNLKTYLNNVKNHLKKDGILILTTPNACAFEFFIHTLIFKRPRVNKYHTHIHTPDTIRYLLESNGFRLIHTEIVQAMNWRTLNLLGKIYYPLTFLIPKRFGRTIITVSKEQ